jgi:hypothetical protein
MKSVLQQDYAPLRMTIKKYNQTNNIKQYTLNNMFFFWVPMLQSLAFNNN